MILISDFVQCECIFPLCLSTVWMLLFRSWRLTKSACVKGPVPSMVLWGTGLVWGLQVITGAPSQGTVGLQPVLFLCFAPGSPWSEWHWGKRLRSDRLSWKLGVTNSLWKFQDTCTEKVPKPCMWTSPRIGAVLVGPPRIEVNLRSGRKTRQDGQLPLDSALLGCFTVLHGKAVECTSPPTSFSSDLLYRASFFFYL